MPSVELIEKRTRNSKTHHLGGRRYAWDGTIGSIHYWDNGWQDIDNAFEPALMPWNWQMLKAGYHIKVKEEFTAGQIIEFETQGETVQFQPMALEWTNDLDQIQPISMPQNVSPVVTNPEVDLLPAVGMPSHQGTIRWNNAYGEGIDFEWKCASSRLVKILEIENLNKLPVPEQYILDGGNPVLRLNLIFDPSSNVDIYVDGELWDKKAKKQTFKAVEFRKDGEVLWGFMPLIYWDSSEDGNYGQSVATVEKRGQSLYISIRVPYRWLQTAVYPVFIDVDIDKDVVATGDDGYAYSTTFMGDYSQLRMGKSSAYDIRTFVRFTGVTIPSGATIGANCYASFFVWNTTQPGVYLKIKADDLANPDAPINTTEVFAITPTTAGVDWDDQADVDDWANTPGIQSVIAELQASYDYSAGAAITIIVDNDGSAIDEILYMWSWDYSDQLYPPKLHIEYSVGGVTHEGAATLSGVGTLAGIGRGIFIGQSTLSGTGTLVAIGRGIFVGAATLAGTGALSALGGLLLAAKATLSGVGSLSAIAGVWKLGAATLSGTGSLAASAVRILGAKATLTGVGTLNAIGSIVAVGIQDKSPGMAAKLVAGKLI